MSAEKHTPTPGHFYAMKCPFRDVEIVPKDIGTLWLVQYRNDDFEGEIAICQGVHAEANAKLFAASKELLAACQAFANAMRDHDAPSMLGLVNALHIADAAIAKAKEQATATQ